MNHPQLDAALQNLHDLPDPPVRDFSDGLFGEEKHAEKCIDLAASFVTAIDKEGGGKELRERRNLFVNHVGAGSAYDSLRKAAHEWMIRLLKEASPDAEVDRVSFSQPCKGFVKRSHVERYLGDPESVLWSPYELLDFCDDLLGLFKNQLLCNLSDNLDGLLGRMKTRHLWGAFLLVASHDALCSPNPHTYRNLRIAIMQSRETVAAIKDAAEDVALALSDTTRSAGNEPEKPTNQSGAPCEGGRAVTEGSIATSQDRTQDVRVSAEENTKPHWDEDTWTLSYGDRVVKRFKQPAENQTAVIAAFEEASWPKRIDDPIPPTVKIDSKRRVNSTVRQLNLCRKADVMWFEAGGNGESFIWHPGPKPANKPAD